MEKRLLTVLLAALFVLTSAFAAPLQASPGDLAQRLRQSGKTVSERLEETRQMLDELEGMLQRCREIGRRLEELDRDLESIQRRLNQLQRRADELEQKISRFKSMLD